MANKMKAVELQPVQVVQIRLLLKEKTVLMSDEAAIYLGISKATLFKMTSQRVIPFFKPNGKLMYFKREELDAWMLSQKASNTENVENKSNNYLLKNI